MSEFWVVMDEFWGRFREVMSDPMWQSLGVIVGGIGVYYGALWGSKKGHKLSVDKEEKDFKNTFDNYVIAYEEELKINLECLNSLKGYVYSNHAPIIEAFNPVDIGATYLKSEVWDFMLKLGLMRLFEYEDFRQLSYSNKNIIAASRTIKIYAANWRRVMAYREWEKTNNVANNADLQVIMETFSNEIKESITLAIGSVKEALAIINNKISY